MPVAAAVIGMAVNVAGDLTLGRAFGVAGIAASTSLATGVSFAVLVVRLRSRHGLIDGRAFVARAALATLAAALAGAMMHLVLSALAGAGAGAAARLAVPAVAGLLLYAAMVRVLLPVQSRELIATFRTALRRA